MLLGVIGKLYASQREKQNENRQQNRQFGFEVQSLLPGKHIDVLGQQSGYLMDLFLKKIEAQPIVTDQDIKERVAQYVPGAITDQTREIFQHQNRDNKMRSLDPFGPGMEDEQMAVKEGGFLRSPRSRFENGSFDRRIPRQIDELSLDLNRSARGKLRPLGNSEQHLSDADQSDHSDHEVDRSIDGNNSLVRSWNWKR